MTDPGEGQGLQSSFFDPKGCGCPTPPPRGPFLPSSLPEDVVSVFPQKEEAPQQGLAEPDLLRSMLAVPSGERLRGSEAREVRLREARGSRVF